MVSKRAIVLAFSVLLAGGLGLAEATLIPPNYFSSPIFWTGYVLSFAIGALLIMNTHPLGYTSNRIMKIGAVIWAVLFGGAIFVSNKVPDALLFGAGVSGIFVGVGVRGFIWFLLKTRWGYCPSCKETAWIEKRGGKWYCMKRGDPIQGLATEQVIHGGGPTESSINSKNTRTVVFSESDTRICRKDIDAKRK